MNVIKEIQELKWTMSDYQNRLMKKSRDEQDKEIKDLKKKVRELEKEIKDWPKEVA